MTSGVDETEKVQKHLSLLREQYLGLQEKCVSLEQKLARVTAFNSAPEDQDSFIARLLKFVASLYNKEEYSDLTVQLHDEEVNAHRFVLAARGDFWDWRDLEEGVGEATLKWIYTDNIDLTDHFLTLKVISAASKFKLTGLIKRCEEVLIGRVTVSNCISLYTIAEEVEAETLKSHCSALISAHWADFTPGDFANMTAPLLYSMIKSKTNNYLHAIVRLRREDVLFLYLIENDSKLPLLLNQYDNNGRLALDISLEDKQWSISKSLIKHGASVNALNHLGETLLHSSISRGDSCAAKFLIENKADCNIRRKDLDQLPLHVIAKTDYCDTNTLECMAEVAKLMLDAGAIASAQDINLKTPLHLAVEKNNMPLVRVLLNTPDIEINIKDEKGLPPLWYALIKSKDFSGISSAALLIEKGAPLDEEIREGNTLLHLVAVEELEEAGIYLTNQGADPSLCNSLGESPLHISCTKGLPSLTSALLEAGADRNQQTYVPNIMNYQDSKSIKSSSSEKIPNPSIIVFKETPLHRAIRMENFDDAMAILHPKSSYKLASELSFDVQDSEGLTSLGVAILNGHLSIAKEILQKGADINMVGDDGRTLLHKVLSQSLPNTTKLAQFLIVNGADPNKKDFDGYSPLHLCIENHLSVVAETLCKKGADLKSNRSSSQDPYLWLSLASGQEDIAEILVRHGVDVDNWAEGPEGCMQTMLHRAIDENREDISCFLVRKGASVNALRRVGSGGRGGDIAKELQTPLHMCCSWGLVATAGEIIRFGGEINAKDAEGKTPFHLALENNHPSLIELLLEQSALDLEAKDHKGLTPFSLAMARKNNKAAQAILRRFPVAAEQYDNKGLNYLHSAVIKKDLESVLFLISIHVSLSSRTKDERQYTPLHLATIQGNEMIVRNLILAGANVNEVTLQKETCLHLCALQDRHTLATIFIQNGVDVDRLDANLNNALHVAIKEGHLATVRVLLTESQINAGAINLRGQNPLHVLATYPKENAAAIAQLFLEALPNYPINNTDVEGNTALLLAYTHGSAQLCRFLVSSGACLGTANKNGVHLFNYEVATKALLRRLLDSVVAEPPWSEGEICLECGTKFGLATRRHHCRHCGRLLCSKCSTKDIPILKFGISKPVRVCHLCFDVLTHGPLISH
ncbi:Rabankyrin-5 [Armadillidium nasatum]|uniref:Rabankyrin-5 n=1 Tax=Armadillidium nasatum TaxID=96803 RepID=A0A5N5T601_9CRUS|nr:Rabankyrin-5 [Armadillidium nasatum]